MSGGEAVMTKSVIEGHREALWYLVYEGSESDERRREMLGVNLLYIWQSEITAR